MYVTDILKMCMRYDVEVNDEEMIFEKITAFLTSQFSTSAHIEKMADGVYFVKSTHPRVFGVSFYYHACMLKTY